MSDSDTEKKDDEKREGGSVIHRAEDNLLLSDESDEDDDISQLDSDPDYEPAIPALPPAPSANDGEVQVEVSNSPAFQCLEELFHQGKLTGTEVAQLKARYMDLFDGLKQSRDNEFALIQQSKRYTTELESQAALLARSDDFPENINSEVGRLREQLLKSSNTIMATEERVDEHLYKIETLKEEKRLMEREYLRMPKPHEIENKKKELEETNEELRAEIDRQQRESKKIKESLKVVADESKVVEDNCDVSRIEIDKLKTELLSINSVPMQISKERERLRKQTMDVEKELQNLGQAYTALSENIESMERSKMGFESEIAEIRITSLKEAESLTELQECFDGLSRDIDLLREKEMTLVSDRAALDLNLRHLAVEKRNVMETHSRKLREKDRDLRALKKSQLQLRVAEEGITLVEQMYEKTKVQYDSVPRDDSSLLDRRKKVQAEVEQIKRSVEQQNSLSAVEHVKVLQSVQDEERLLYDLSDRRIEVVELTRLAAIKADEREQKARDFMRAELRYHRAVEDFKSKKLQIHDHKKKFSEMQIKLRDFAKLYDVIKTKRNQCVNMIQTTTQKASEMREKLRILHNEVEILRSSLQTKEKQLGKLRMKQASSIVMRDTLRHELGKERRVINHQKEIREQYRLDMQRMTQMVNSAEEQMVQLRKDSDRAVQHRNDRAIQLIERNEEVYILQEKTKIQETMIRTGEIELSAREEQIDFLRRHVEELVRTLTLQKKQVPNKRNLESELTTLQIQLSLCQDRIILMEESSEDPENKSRLRLLGGTDPGPLELQNKVELLEVRLASKEELLLEKELLYEAVCRLVGQVEKKALSGKEDTLKLSKDVNGFKSRMSHVTKRMKATTAELTMHMAEALRLQQDVREKEYTLQESYKRMERGEAPSAEVEMEWLRQNSLRNNRLRDMELAQMSTEEISQLQLANGGVTTAEPRPNAYIPDDDAELPIPRPYGGHAPFRPTEQGTNMRHIRKPKLKPIEI